MREKIFHWIEPYHHTGRVSIYNIILVVIILVTTLPLVCKQTYGWFRTVEILGAFCFTVDAALRWITADYKIRRKAQHIFLYYPLTFMAIIDLMAAISCILCLVFPSMAGSTGFKFMRLFGFLKLLRYMRSKTLAVRVLKRQRKQLLAVCYLAVAYVVLMALVGFIAEPEIFNSFFDAIYWSVISLTTVGYGDIYPVSTIGHIITILSSFFGIAIIALPAGIITAGMMQELNVDGKG